MTCQKNPSMKLIACFSCEKLQFRQLDASPHMSRIKPWCVHSSVYIPLSWMEEDDLAGLISAHIEKHGIVNEYLAPDEK